MEALHRRDPRIEFELFTQVPEWFFVDSLSRRFSYHSLLTDIGLVQKTPFAADLPQTVTRLQDFYPSDPERVEHLAAALKRGQSELVICDIAPLGIVAARSAGIPGLLVENFTWDWIYEAYATKHGGFSAHIDYLKTVFDSADYRIQTEPVCRPSPADLTVSPVSRNPRTPAFQVRNQLGLPAGATVVLITAGGIPFRFPCLERISGHSGIFFLIPGMSEKIEVRGSVILLPHRSGFYHPDLVNASDAVVGKVGYSTLTEVYWSGVPFGYVVRQGFRESEALALFIEKHMAGMAIAEDALNDGSWVLGLGELLSIKPHRPAGVNGADQIAEAILGWIGSDFPLSRGERDGRCPR